MSRGCVLLLSIPLSLVAGCGDDDADDGDGGAISCRLDAEAKPQQCLEYSVPPDAAAATRDGCTAGGGTLVASCPSANRLGTCTAHVGSTITIVTRYYANGLTLDTAAEICSGTGGSWAPG